MAEHGIVIRGGEVIDGSGRPRFRADVAIDDDRIAAVGRLAGAGAEREIEAGGRIVCPGFIDTHTHDDRLLRDGGDMAPKASQGVTTVVAGNCGISLAPLVARERPPPPLDLVGEEGDFRYATFAAYVAELERAPPACNAALLVGHGTLRLAAMGDVDRPATARERQAMRAGVAEAMAAGAIGLSTGLEYPQGARAETGEVVELASAAAGGIYATHMRSYGAGARSAFDEACRIGREAGLAVVISHFHCHEASRPALCGEALAWLEAARAAGLEIAADAYPYAASSTAILPQFIERRARVLIAWSKPHPQAGGRFLDDVAAEWGIDRLAAAARLAPGGAIYFGRPEENVERLMAHPAILIGSDGIPLCRHPHPRLWGTFARVLGRYVRELGLMTMEAAIHRMTAAPAATFGLAGEGGRGLVAPGQAADLVVFDPATVADAATFACPERPATGIERVLVNGVEVWTGARAAPCAPRGGPTGARPGRVLRRLTRPRPAAIMTAVARDGDRER